ncbi:helix-turn-helix domain-containing protein [Candidatus Methylomirabilis sp.]|uniref:helix-turn-helix domain-containing protein n=1 Tax=Candidatus Methylomirabilis sp. TaxID=2032687 RepID=UPI003C70E15C
MSRAKHIQNKFPEALKAARNARGLSQEAFSLASSRTYVSSLERGLGIPTLKKVDELAEVLDLHPLTLLTLSYLGGKDRKAADALFAQVSRELLEIWKQTR